MALGTETLSRSGDVSAEEKVRIVLHGLRGESSIAELCRREGIAEGLYYSWLKEFLEAGKLELRLLKKSMIADGGDGE